MGKWKTNYVNGWVDFSIHQLFQGMQEEKKPKFQTDQAIS